MTIIIRIIHEPSDTLLAEGPKGWGITPFEGNYYIGRKYMKTERFKVNYLPGICFYKFLYVWQDLVFDDYKVKNIGWMYWLPNPLFPFIAFRTAVPSHHPQLKIEEYELELLSE